MSKKFFEGLNLERQRRSVLQPKVAAYSRYLGFLMPRKPNPNGVAPLLGHVLKLNQHGQK